MKKFFVMLMGAIMCCTLISSCGNGYNSKCEELAKALDSDPIQVGTATNILAELLSNVDKLNTEQAASACIATYAIIMSGEIAGSEVVYESMLCNFYEQAAKNPSELKKYDDDSNGTLTAIYETAKSGGFSSTDEGDYDETEEEY